MKQCIEVWPLEEDDVTLTLATRLADQHPTLELKRPLPLGVVPSAWGFSEVMTFDQSLRGAFSTIS